MKVHLFVFLFAFIFLSVGAQNTRSYRQPLEANNVPKKVREAFKTRYPDAFVKMWYITNITYWYQDYGPSHYNGWYQPRTVVVYNFSEPANYEVEFVDDYEQSRAIFNRYGAWFETRTKVVHLPDPIKSAVEKSEYGTWSWSEYKERIEAPGMPGSVYRMHVASRHDDRIIRINEEGRIIQIKTD